MRIATSGLALCLLSGCIIGTWPTPEARDNKGTSAAGPSQQETAGEACDSVDNDADGVVDEGCSCDPGDVRGCIGVEDGQCGLGVQQCLFGTWRGCSNIGPPYSAPQAPAVGILDVAPASLVRGGTEPVTVRVAAAAACPGIQVPHVDVVLESSEPVVMRVTATAYDDGEAPDAHLGDGEHTATLVNAFGPGVPAQALTLRAAASINGKAVIDETTVPLEEP